MTACSGKTHNFSFTMHEFAAKTFSHSFVSIMRLVRFALYCYTSTCEADPLS